MPDTIEKLRELRQSSRSAVIVATESPATDRPFILHAVETWLDSYLLEQLTSPTRTLQLLVLAGNAGDGKSFLLQSLRNRLERDSKLGPDDVQWVLDASHSNERTQRSSDRLNEFFKPFSNEADWLPSRMHIIAMNTGAIVQFFENADEFSDLKMILYAQLGVERPDNETLVRSTMKFDRVLVVDLDRRLLFPPEPEVSPFLAKMLDEITPDGPWLSAATKSCQACNVAAQCPVNANLAALRLPDVRKKLSRMLQDVALEDRVHIGPRSLWHLLYLMTVGGLDRYAVKVGAPLPNCDDVAALVPEHRAAGLFYTALFDEAEAHEGLFELMAELRRVDPRDHFSIDAFRLALAASLSADEDVRLAAPVAARLGVAAELLAARGSAAERAAAQARRTFFLGDSESLSDRETALDDFRRLLVAYRESVLSGTNFRDRAIGETLMQALQQMHETRVRGHWHVVLPWAAAAEVLVKVELRAPAERVDDIRVVGSDTWRTPAPRPESLELAKALDAYPLAVHVSVRTAAAGGGTRIRVTWSLFRILRKVGAGYLAGSLDPERVQHLERIAAVITAGAARKALAVANAEGGWTCEDTGDGHYEILPLRL